MARSRNARLAGAGRKRDMNQFPHAPSIARCDHQPILPVANVPGKLEKPRCRPLHVLPRCRVDTVPQFRNAAPSRLNRKSRSLRIRNSRLSDLPCGIAQPYPVVCDSVLTPQISLEFSPQPTVNSRTRNLIMPDETPKPPEVPTEPQPPAPKPPGLDLGPGVGINVTQDMATPERSLPTAKIVLIALAGLAVVLAIYGFVGRAKARRRLARQRRRRRSPQSEFDAGRSHRHSLRNDDEALWIRDSRIDRLQMSDDAFRPATRTRPVCSGVPRSQAEIPRPHSCRTKISRQEATIPHRQLTPYRG